VIIREGAAVPSEAPTLTLQDVADLARVQRPVVSMWRNRPVARGRFLPFPGPVATGARPERFRREEIVDWLRETGRGNNDEAGLDAPTLSVPVGTSLEDVITLLCLRGHGDGELSGSSVEQLARKVDARDEFLLREAASVATSPDVLGFVDELVASSFGGEDALARLERGRLGREAGARDLSAEAVELMRPLAAAGALHLDPEGVPLVHTGGAETLALALADEFTRLVTPGAADRGLRRRAAIRGIVTAAGVTGPCVRLASVTGAEPDAALDALDDAVLELGGGDVAVLLGPAGVLCDELRGERERRRAETLRAGALAMALRLPRGLWREAHRQALGVWICAGHTHHARPLVADLGALGPDELNAGDLAADVTGALALDRARAFAYSRPNDLQSILTGRPVVPRGARATRLGTTEPAPRLKRIRAAATITAEPLDGFDVLAAAAPGSLMLRRRSLGELVEAGHARVRRGSRIDPAHAEEAGSVAVLAADGALEHLRLDPFAAARSYPRAARTEPGDVIFTERPRPRARVDDAGGALVASPSRLLQLAPAAGVGPHAVAAIINEQPVDARDWQAWEVPVLPAAEADALDAALAAATDYEAALSKRLEAVGTLKAAVIDGVTAGVVTLRTDEKEGA
jgi:hypothetical protein